MQPREDRCSCKCHQATLGTARAAFKMGNEAKTKLWYRRYSLEGIVGVDVLSELDAFFACTQCLPLHCRALSGRPLPVWNPPPLKPYDPEEDDGN